MNTFSDDATDGKGHIINNNCYILKKNLVICVDNILDIYCNYLILFQSVYKVS
jgi:hypothetical protein